MVRLEAQIKAQVQAQLRAQVQQVVRYPVCSKWSGTEFVAGGQFVVRGMMMGQELTLLCKLCGYGSMKLFLSPQVLDSI